MYADDFRRIALGMKDAIESAHMGHPDFRVAGRIFATLRDDRAWAMVKLTPEEQHAFIADRPRAFKPESGAWGRSGCTAVRLDAVDEDALGEALTLAWRHAVARGPVKRARRPASKPKARGSTASPCRAEPAAVKAPPVRCAWARTGLSTAYHDREWGVPVHDDRQLFELLTLEGAQAGLSWETILRKREAYRKAFAGFDPARVARFRAADVRRLLKNPGIVRNRLKILSTVGNAKAFLAIQREFGSFDAYVWRFVGGSPRVNLWTAIERVPARTPESDALSRDLLARGFTFVGSTICYAFMQAVGLVNDHTIDCFRRVPRAF